MTSPGTPQRPDPDGPRWSSPYLKPAATVAPGPPPPSGTPPGVRRVLALVVALVTVVVLWSLLERYFLRPPREISLARPGAAAGGGELAASASRGDSAARVPGAVATPVDTTDEALRLLDPRRLVGSWHHGDARSRYGDSLVLVLRPDGEARSAERRYTLDQRGWHVARVARAGTWSVRYRASFPPQLCTAWRTPRTAEACEQVELLADSADVGQRLRFAGRHWTRAAAPPD